MILGRFFLCVCDSIRRIFESGLHAYQLKIWQQRKPECPQSAVVVAPIDLEHFAAALWLLAGGIAASAAVLAGECAVEWWRKRPRLGRKQVVAAGVRRASSGVACVVDGSRRLEQERRMCT